MRQEPRPGRKAGPWHFAVSRRPAAGTLRERAWRAQRPTVLFRPDEEQADQAARQQQLLLWRGALPLLGRGAFALSAAAVCFGGVSAISASAAPIKAGALPEGLGAVSAVSANHFGPTKNVGGRNTGRRLGCAKKAMTPILLS